MTELTQQEMVEIEGGVIFIFLAGVAVGAAGGYIYGKYFSE